MTPDQQNEFKGFAKVEVMGHQSHIGYVTTEVYGAAVLFRIDQPALAEETRTLTEKEWHDGRYLHPGSVVKEAAIPGASVLVGAGSIYRIVPCSEEVCMRAIRAGVRRPLLVVSEPPAAPQLESGEHANYKCCGNPRINGHSESCRYYVEPEDGYYVEPEDDDDPYEDDQPTIINGGEPL